MFYVSPHKNCLEFNGDINDTCQIFNNTFHVFCSAT